jgi:hypothetical protein
MPQEGNLSRNNETQAELEPLERRDQFAEIDDTQLPAKSIA